MSVDQPFNVYREQLSSQYHGLALWDPKPVENLHKQPGHVSIGDVGYLDNGAFMRMFNVTLPWDDPSNKLLGNPEKYERIEPRHFDNVRDNEIREGEYYTPQVSRVVNVGANTHEESIGQMYQCKAQHRGALLSLPYKGHRKDVISIKIFEDYIKDNVVNWFRWSKKMKLPVEHMEDLILVTGCTLVKSWAAAAFDGHMSVDDATAISLETGKTDNGGAQFFWRNPCGSVEYHNSRFDPNVQESLSRNQCVFIRGFRAKRTFFRTIPMRAAAEPLPDDHDDRREDEIEVTRIPGDSRYRDPLVGILDYIIQKCNEDISSAEEIMAIAHDDDLRLVEGVETLTADAIEEFLHRKQTPLLVENGAAVLQDPMNNELDEPPRKNRNSRISPVAPQGVLRGLDTDFAAAFLSSPVPVPVPWLETSSYPSLTPPSLTPSLTPPPSTPPPLPDAFSSLAHSPPPPKAYIPSSSSGAQSLPSIPPPPPTLGVYIHPALAAPSLQYDMRSQPSHSNPRLSPAILSTPASSPPLSSITIRVGDLPWLFTVSPDAGHSPDNAFVTVQDVLVAIYSHLRTPVKGDEYEALSKARKKEILLSFESRVSMDISQGGKGLCRVDFLGGRFRAQGLVRTRSKESVWGVVIH